MAKLAEDIEEQIDLAMEEGRDFYDDEVATSVRYVATDDRFVLVLKSGRRVVIPREDLQDVAELSVEDAADVALVELCSVVEWEKPDIGFGVKGLADGLYGNERWMKQLDERRRKNAAAALERTA
jgi:hypothetical protein